MKMCLREKCWKGLVDEIFAILKIAWKLRKKKWKIYRVKNTSEQKEDQDMLEEYDFSKGVMGKYSKKYEEDEEKEKRE